MLQVRWASLIRLACVLLALGVIVFQTAFFGFDFSIVPGFVLSVAGAYFLCIIAAEMVFLALSFTDPGRDGTSS